MKEFPSETPCPSCKEGKLVQVTEGEANIVVSEKCDKCDFEHDLRKPRNTHKGDESDVG